MEKTAVMSDDPFMRTLHRGSVRERALMIANHYASSNRYGKPQLSTSQLQALLASFDSLKDRKQFDTYSRYFQNVETYLANLSQLRLNYQEALQRLDKLLVLRQANQDLEDMGNAMLKGVDGQIEQLLAAKEARNFIGRSGDYRSVKVKIGKNYGYIQVLDGPMVSIEAATAIISELTETLVKIKTSIAVVKDFEKETRFVVNVFHDYPKVVQAWIKGQDERMPMLVMDKKTLAKSSAPRIREIADMIDGAPKMESLEIEPKQYEADKKALYG